MIDDRFRDPRQPDAEPLPSEFERADLAVRTVESHFVDEASRLQRQLDRDRQMEAPLDDAYLALPLGVRMRYNRVEYLWLSDAEKATLVQRECEPDC